MRLAIATACTQRMASLSVPATVSYWPSRVRIVSPSQPPPRKGSGSVGVGALRVMDAGSWASVTPPLVTPWPARLPSPGTARSTGLRVLVMVTGGMVTTSRWTAATRPAACCATWVSSWASSRWPAGVCGAYWPGPKTISRPLV
jgi:hypothetical protein